MPGGQSIQDECHKHVKENGTLLPGEVYVSAAGELKCNHVIHAVGPIWRDGQSGEDDCLYDCVYKSLEEANKRQVKSIAIPAISTGVFGFPVKNATRTMMEALKDYFQRESRTSVKEVILVDIAGKTVNTFHEAMCGALGESKVKRKTPRMQEVSDKGDAGKRMPKKGELLSAREKHA